MVITRSTFRWVLAFALLGSCCLRSVFASEDSLDGAASILRDKKARPADKVRAFEDADRVLDQEPDNARAMHIVGLAHQLGNGVTQDLDKAFEYFKTGANLGHAPCQEEMGVAYLAGLGTQVDTARGLLYLYFAAAANQTSAQLALGYRHMYGLAVPKSCQAAVLYYNPPVEGVVKNVKGPGRNMPSVERVRLSVDHDTNYNPGREQEMVQYYQYSADMGNSDAQTAIGQLFNFGSRGMEQDHERALHYFKQAAASGDPDAMAHLGHMFANGVGVEADNETALSFFKKASEKGHPSALYGLGYMFLSGAGVDRNYKKAANFFTQAAEQGNADAQFHLGVMAEKGLLARPDHQKAFQHFNIASHQGHMLAIYNLAMMQLAGHGVPVSCKNALQLLKSVSEHGLWAQILENAHAAYLEGRTDVALTLYMKAAEIGLEVGQSNAAWLLERRGRGRAAEEPDAAFADLHQAIHYHQLAADQGNVNSLLQIGDAHYYGKGTQIDVNKSVAVYRQATQLRSAQAMFNLGVLHEHGIGLPQDLHLAKRYYDMAKQAQPEAYVPIKLALLKLAAHVFLDKHKEKMLDLGGVASTENGVLAALTLALLAVLAVRHFRRTHADAAQDNTD